MFGFDIIAHICPRLILYLHALTNINVSLRKMNLVMLILAFYLSSAPMGNGKIIYPFFKCWLTYSLCYEQCTASKSRFRGWYNNDLMVASCISDAECQNTVPWVKNNQIVICIHTKILERLVKENPNKFLGRPGEQPEDVGTEATEDKMPKQPENGGKTAEDMKRERQAKIDQWNEDLKAREADERKKALLGIVPRGEVAKETPSLEWRYGLVMLGVLCLIFI